MFNYDGIGWDEVERIQATQVWALMCYFPKDYYDSHDKFVVEGVSCVGSLDAVYQRYDDFERVGATNTADFFAVPVEGVWALLVMQETAGLLMAAPY